MWPAACGVALISFTESIAAARAFLRSSDAPIDANRELLALGAANVAGAFIGSIPSGGGTSQTAVNRAAGAQTQISSLVVAAAALLTLLFLAPVLALLPQATLGAVVVAYSIALLDPAEMLAIRRVRKMEFHWALAACLGVMTLGTLKGIVIAIVLSLGGLIRLASDLRVDEIVRIPGSHLFRARSARHPHDQAIPGLLIARPVGRVYFGNAEGTGGKLMAMIKTAAPRVVLLDCSAIPGLEYTALKMLVDRELKLHEEGVELWLAALNPEALKLVRRTPLAERLGQERMFRTVGEAVDRFEARETARTLETQ